MLGEVQIEVGQRLQDSDVLVVGAGVAGISLALWLDGLEVSFAWVCAAPAVGGTLLRVGNSIDNYPGLVATDGPAFVHTLEAQLGRRNLSPIFGLSVQRVWRHNGGFGIELLDASGPSTATVSRVALCTGTRPRRLGLPGENDLWGRGIDVAVTANLEQHRGRVVVVAGGGDGALEGALRLSKVCKRVHLVCRGRRLGGQRRFAERVQARDNIDLHLQAVINELEVDGAGDLSGVRLAGGERLAASGLFERLGVEPVLPEGLQELLCADGYLNTDLRGISAWPRLYGAGDVCGREHQSIASAVGMAARLAECIQVSLGHKRP